MNNIIESKLLPLLGYFYSLDRDTVNGWYTLKMGIPQKWDVFENDLVTYEVIYETEEGKLIKISPKNEQVTSDDLIQFCNIIINGNKEIEKKEEEFNKKMNDIKSNLEKEVANFYVELNVLKKNALKAKFNNDESKNEEPKVKPKRKTKNNTESNTKKDTEDNTE